MNKHFRKIFLILFAILYISVALVSTFHAISFFGLANNSWVSVMLAITFEIGQAAVNSLRKYGVDTTEIVRGGDRVGIYYLEKGASQRPSKVIYDRAGSSIATASAADFDWKHIFAGADWFHFTGITPALNDEVAKICLEACKAAKEAGLTISCDLN